MYDDTRLMRARTAFSNQELRAFELGQKMAEAAFNMRDNPFADVQPRLARKWLDGFLTRTTLRTVATTLHVAARQHPHADSVGA